MQLNNQESFQTQEESLVPEKLTDQKLAETKHGHFITSGEIVMQEKQEQSKSNVSTMVFSPASPVSSANNEKLQSEN